MPSAQLTCPKCQTVLRPAKPLAPGAVVQCPKCATRFRAGGPAAQPTEPAAPAGAADDFASFSRPDEEPTTRPRRRGGCGLILVGCLFLLAPLLGAGGVLGYCAVVYWRPSIQSMIQGVPSGVKDKDKEPDKPKDQGADKP